MCVCVHVHERECVVIMFYLVKQIYIYLCSYVNICLVGNDLGLHL